MEVMKCVSHQQACQLLHNKFVLVLGDSIQRSVYKDFVVLLQKDKYLSIKQLKNKGEMSFELDCLVEGGCLSEMHNGKDYREVRQFQSAHHLVRFYFVTRIYSRYMQSILEDIRHGLKPDVVIVNSCVWDISRYNSTWINDYKENLYKFFDELSRVLPEETLVVWSLTLPVGERIKGGFLVPEIEHKASRLRYDVIEANFYSGTLADAYGMDVLDFHFQFRFSMQHRTRDGIHWNALAHRRITSLLLQHVAQAWGVIMPCPLSAVGTVDVTNKQPVCGSAPKPAGKTSKSGVSRAARASHNPPPSNYYSNMEGNYSSFSEDFYSSHSYGYLSFEDNHFQPQTNLHRAAGSYRCAHRSQPYLPVHRHYNNGQARNGSNDRPPYHFEPYNEHHHQHVMRSRHRKHYAPYDYYRPHQPARYVYYC